MTRGRVTNLLGVVYNGIEIISRAGSDEAGGALWEAKCHCGEIFELTGRYLKKHNIKSCGCLGGKRHGKSKTRLYRIWTHMKTRCYDEKAHDYERYGGRGIDICSEWRYQFPNFESWALENGYQDSLTIDRINNDKGYAPNNCRWTDKTTQVRNRRVSKNSKTGVTGVVWSKHANQWLAYLYLNYKQKTLGYYKNLEDAIRARQQGEIKVWGYTKITEEQIQEALKTHKII